MTTNEFTNRLKTCTSTEPVIDTLDENGQLLPRATNEVRTLDANGQLLPRAGRSWFYPNELATIYKFPSPSFTTNKNIAVISFGGGLYGTVSPTGVLTNGDCQQYWQSLGISQANMPTVIVIPINGASNRPNVNDRGATAENTLDVQQIGACCPTSKLTIILYIAPNNLTQFVNVMDYILNASPYPSSMISISWGAPEIYYSSTLLTNINNRFATAVARGINICAATGDNGSNNGVGGSGSYTDFPASSPNVIACGGTKLVCPNLVYDSSTTEVAWTYGGGAISAYFAKPTYQNSLSVVKRSIPDIAMNADPNTGVAYLVNGSYYIYGGTSVAAPTVAAYLMALNTTRPAHNVFYTNVNAFNDVVSGTNGAFNASLGYDNCTGLGSINGTVLTTAFNNQPSQPSQPPQPPQPPQQQVVAVSSVRLSLSSLRIKFNRTYQLNPTILPSNATNKSLTWTSNNTRIITVSSTGLIRTINYGTATVRVRSVSNPNRSATISITVIR